MAPTKTVEFAEPQPEVEKKEEKKASKRAPPEKVVEKEEDDEIEEDEEDFSDDMDLDDYDEFDDDDDEEDEEDMEGALAEILEGVFTTEDGATMAQISQEIGDHLANITKVLNNTNKILIKILQKN